MSNQPSFNDSFEKPKVQNIPDAIAFLEFPVSLTSVYASGSARRRIHFDPSNQPLFNYSFEKSKVQNIANAMALLELPGYKCLRVRGRPRAHPQSNPCSRIALKSKCPEYPERNGHSGNFTFTNKCLSVRERPRAHPIQIVLRYFKPIFVNDSAKKRKSRISRTQWPFWNFQVH